jgi:RimJ/RimL family protein N-acetyltransferase
LDRQGGTGPTLPRRTERLVLRPFRHGDEADVLAYRGRADVVRYMPTDRMPADVAEAFVEERRGTTRIVDDHDRIVLAVEHGGRVVGDVMLLAGELASRQAEIGWVLNPDVQGRGLATEAARELLALAFDHLNMHRVWAQLDPRNVASARLCERLGMRKEAHFRQDLWFKGEWSDTAIYALLADEWRGRQGRP